MTPTFNLARVVSVCFFFSFLLIFDNCKKDSFYKITWKEFVYEGDSITDLSSGLPYNYPYQLKLISTDAQTSQQFDVGLAGDLAESMVGEYASQVHPLKPAAGDNPCLFLFMAGINDCRAGRTPAQIYAYLQQEWSYARADNFKVVAFCITRSAVATDSVAVAVNKLIISDQSKYDYLIRTDLILPNPSDTTLFKLDGVHPKPAGSAIIAKEVKRVVDLN